jgi:hypothetical protein
MIRRNILRGMAVLGLIGACLGPVLVTLLLAQTQGRMPRGTR